MRNKKDEEKKSGFSFNIFYFLVFLLFRFRFFHIMLHLLIPLFHSIISFFMLFSMCVRPCILKKWENHRKMGIITPKRVLALECTCTLAESGRQMRWTEDETRMQRGWQEKRTKMEIKRMERMISCYYEWGWIVLSTILFVYDSHVWTKK